MIPDAVLQAAVARAALGNLSVVARSKGNLALAATLSEEELRRIAGLNLDRTETRTLIDLGEIAREQGNHRLAVERYLTALARMSERGEKRLIADALTGIAVAATVWGQRRTALLLFAAADALREREGIALMLPADAATAERHLGALREALGDDFAAIWAEGRALSASEAVAVASTVAPLPSALPAAPAQGAITLTRRERDVLRLLAAGQTNREIADALYMSPRTAEWHVRHILDKLGLATRREAVAQAREQGVV